MILLTIFALGSLLASQGGQASDNKANAKPPAQSQSDADRERSGADPLLDLPPLPDGKTTLIGGTITKLDSVTDRMSVLAFGGKKIDMTFDVRTKVYRDGGSGGLKDIRPGDRVYVDTVLNGDHIFAKSIRVTSNQPQGQARGQVVAYDAGRNLLTLHEQVSPDPVKFHVTANTAVLVDQRSASVNDLRAGSLVEVSFAPGSDKIDEARQIRVVANPGATFTFAGTVTFVDLRLKRMAIANRSDKETYEITLASLPADLVRQLKEGAEATVNAVFDGKGYQAKSIELAAATTKQE